MADLGQAVKNIEEANLLSRRGFLGNLSKLAVGGAFIVEELAVGLARSSIDDVVSFLTGNSYPKDVAEAVGIPDKFKEDYTIVMVPESKFHLASIMLEHLGLNPFGKDFLKVSKRHPDFEKKGFYLGTNSDTIKSYQDIRVIVGEDEAKKFKHNAKLDTQDLNWLFSSDELTLNMPTVYEGMKELWGKEKKVPGRKPTNYATQEGLLKKLEEYDAELKPEKDRRIVVPDKEYVAFVEERYGDLITEIKIPGHEKMTSKEKLARVLNKGMYKKHFPRVEVEPVGVPKAIEKVVSLIPPDDFLDAMYKYHWPNMRSLDSYKDP